MPAEWLSNESTAGRPMLGKYELLARLGQGGMADVFLAATRGAAGFLKLIVIKRLRPDFAEHANIRAMFLDEARVAAQLNHPNVVGTFEIVEDGRLICMAMDYLDGQSLDALARECRARKLVLEPELTLRIVADALAGLHYAHELRDFRGAPLNIVHRDVSPDNIFITFDGQTKMVDFGIAKAESRLAKTEVGTLKGKVTYMAPEQIKGDQVDRRADVFAAGIVLWELLTGKRLMVQDSTLAIMHSVLNDAIVPPSELMAMPDPALDAIVLRALDQEPSRRFQTASEMRRALEGYLRKHPATTDDVASRMRMIFGDVRDRFQAEIHAYLDEGVVPQGKLEWITKAEQTSDVREKIPSARSRSDVEAAQTRIERNAVVSTRADRASGAPPSRPAPMNPTLKAEPSVPTELDVTLAHDMAPSMRSDPPVRAERARAAVVPKDPSRPSKIAAGATLCLAVGVVVFLGLRARFGAKHVEMPTPAPVASVSSVVPVLPVLPASVFAPILRLHGSNTIGSELAPALAAAFLKRSGATDITRRADEGAHALDVVGSLKGVAQGIEIQAEGSGTAFEDLGADKCDIGMASRPIKPEEAAKLASLGDLRLPASEHVFGLDGIAVIVHPNNTLRALDTTRLDGMFAGKISDWKAVGGGPLPIHVYARDDRSGTYDTFKHLVLGNDPLVSSATRFDDSAALSQAVAVDPNGIGFVGFRSVGNAKTIAVSEPGAKPFYPSAFTVATEEYALTRRLYLYTPARPKTTLSADFVKFALSVEGQQIVRETGFVDLTIRVTEAPPCTEGCPPRYASIVRHDHRLSLDFHFQKGSAELDSRSLPDADRLVDFLRAYSNPRVVLVGFADRGGESQSEVLSKERAHKVADELAARGVRAAKIEGFGSQMPIASNATDAGRERNRRVEVWLE